MNKVLLAEDDPVMLVLLSRWLESAGYQVQTASNGVEALAVLQQDCPDFLLTDWEMPLMDGVELCRAVRQMNLARYVYVLIISHHAKSADVVVGLEAGADDFLAKPIQRGELIARLHAGARILELERRLGDAARNDALTGIPTQKTFYERLQAEWSRARRYRLPLSCVMFDLDFFKRVNDTHGHQAGDDVLRRIAEMIATNCRASDIICRYGGEEFAVLLPETAETQAALWADRLRKRIGENPMEIAGRTVSVTASFGVAERLEDTDNAEELVDLADQALLVAKQMGRDRVVRFSQAPASSNLGWASAAGHGALFGGVLARDVMTAPVLCLSEDRSIGEASEFFLDHRVDSAPVVDSQGRLVGVLSEKDLIGTMLWPESWSRSVSEVMKRNVVCYDQQTPALVIYEFLCRVSLRGIIVVDGGKPTGVVSRGSLLRWFRGWLSRHRHAAACGLTDATATAERRQNLLNASRSLSADAARLALRLETGDDLSEVSAAAEPLRNQLHDLLFAVREQAAAQSFAEPQEVLA